MTVPDSFVQGTVFFHGELEELARVFSEAGVEFDVGQWALRLFRPQTRFEIAYVGNICPDAPFEVRVDGYDVTLETISAWCEVVSRCLQHRGIKFEMTHFASAGEEIHAYNA